MQYIIANGTAEYEFISALKKRAEEVDMTTTASVLQIINEVRDKGDEAVRAYGLRFDQAAPEQFEIKKEELQLAYENAEPEFRKALLAAAKNIKEYHELQKESDIIIEKEQGVKLGLLIRGMDRVGIYVPGGTAAYPSTVLMNAIPAKIAGVREIVMITPPAIIKESDGSFRCEANPDILTAAYIAGVDRVFLAGGAQAVAALTFGTESFPKVDKIVGPGNIFVATAKKLLFGQVDIDMIAGPSEVLVLADETATPAYIAADLLSQAEHDVLAAPILITNSERIADETTKELIKQTALQARNEIIEKSVKEQGAIIVCKNVSEMIELANLIAPEHLEIMMKEPLSILPEIRNAGSVFCGDHSPEPLGDYFAGTNHVLPTSGTARFSSPLGV
ncbi:MAG: histidinol dehydrogenase, partial [Eubacteriales bacterium]|nr:histidinol dehydrogenase [Eubacteriales bacterium]